MQSGFNDVTPENFLLIRAYIQNEISHFRINSETWVLVLFNKIPKESSVEAVEQLNVWIRRYLSKRIIREMVFQLGLTNLSQPEPFTLKPEISANRKNN
ncbi:MAG: hypothetical protein HQL67_04710 [Magnetococcales bacterium]|nr:hypothetical protein [Magnetococcales bacterium]